MRKNKNGDHELTAKDIIKASVRPREFKGILGLPPASRRIVIKEADKIYDN